MSWETNPKEINKLMKEKMNDEQALKANVFRLKMRLPVKSGLLFETASFHPLTTQILEAMAKSRRMLEAESLWSRATRKEFENDWGPAFHLYLQAADTFFEVFENSKNAVEKTRSKNEAAKALERAAKLKKAHPDLKPPPKNPFSPKEQMAIVKASSEVGQTKYPLWKDPTPEEYSDTTLYRDQTMLGSVPTDTWEAASKALTSPLMIDPRLLPSELVQSLVSNCSVVASIIVCWNHHRRHNSKLMISRLYPQTPEGLPIASPNHKYHYPFDDMLPVRDGRLMSITATRFNSLWPSLVEKAYMKYHGGYDFVGSDPGVDLCTMVGWIPEHHSFRRSTFERERIWKAIASAFLRGDLLISLGTAASLSDSARELNLIPLHSYACIDLEETDDRLVTIVNPWRHSLSNQELHDSLAGLSINSDGGDRFKLFSDARRLSWEDICNIFDGIYLSWNPQVFQHVIVHHRSWKRPRNQSDSFSPDLNHQIRLLFDGDTEGEVWALLTRHSTEHNNPLVYIALHAFEEEGSGVGFIELESLTIRGQYHQSPHCLVKLDLRKQTKSISLIASLNIPESTPPQDISYSLVVYSKRSVAFDISNPPSVITKFKNVTFNAMNSGGNILLPSYFRNPQWKLKVHPLRGNGASEMARQTILLRALATKNMALNIKVYRTSKSRLNDPSDGTLVFDSGTYNFGLTFGQTDMLPGEYIVILSTFAQEQHGKATLEVSSMNDLTLESAPSEGAAMHLVSRTGRWGEDSAAGGPSYGSYWMNPTYQVTLERATEIILHLQPSCGSKYLPINISLFREASAGQMELGSEIATSGPYQESLYGVRITQRRIPAGTYLLIASTHSPGLRREFNISCWSDTPITFRELGGTKQ